MQRLTTTQDENDQVLKELNKHVSEGYAVMQTDIANWAKNINYA